MSSFFSCLLVIALSCAAASGAALKPVPTLPQPSLPVAGIEVNQGQAKAGILFLSPGGTSMAVTAQSVLYSPLGTTLSLLASNPNPAVSFSDPLPGLVNSYTGSDPTKWVTGIQRYTTANVAAVYPGINAQYTIGANGVLVLNLMLAAGADPKAVAFQIAQATSITLNSAGTLFANLPFYTPLPGLTLSYPAPAAFQTTATGQVSRTVSFTVQSATTFGLAVQGVDATLPLQISIQLDTAGAYQPSFGRAHPQRISDAAGNTYFAATIADAAGKDAPFPAIGSDGCGQETGNPIPCSDVAVYKYSAAGVLDFITYFAGRTSESAGFLGLAPDGALAVAGTTDSSDFPVTASALQPAYAGPPAAPDEGTAPVSGDFFAAVLDPATGLLQSSTFLGGPNADTMGTAALGADGSLYFLPSALGAFSIEMPVTRGSLQASCQENPCQNGYAARLSPALDKLIYGTYLPGIDQATAQLYSDGSVFYAGTSEAGFPATPGAYQPQNAGGYDGIVAKLDPTGSNLTFATYYGGPKTDWILDIAVAPDGSVWAEVSSFVQCCVNIQNTLIHLDANGAHLRAQQPIEVDQMVVDTAGNLIALSQGNFTVSSGALLGGPCGSDDAAYIELSPTGQQLFATYLPEGIGGFDSADAQGTPYLDTSTGGRVEIVQNQSMGPIAGCLVDAASFSNEMTVSPGAIVTIFGSGLGPNPGIGFEFVNGQVPALLGGTQVLVNGEPAPILYSSYWQLNLILPYSLAAGTIPDIQVVSNGTPANLISQPDVNPSGVTLFQVNNSAAALNQDGTVNSPHNPAQPGSTVMLFGTGGGQTNPHSIAGELTPLALVPLIFTPIVQIGGTSTSLTVAYAGAAPGLLSGVTQINVTLPSVIPVISGYPAGTLPLQTVGFDGTVSSIVTISVAAN